MINTQAPWKKKMVSERGGMRREGDARGTRLRVFTWGLTSGFGTGASSIFLGGSMEERVQKQTVVNAQVAAPLLLRDSLSRTREPSRASSRLEHLSRSRVHTNRASRHRPRSLPCSSPSSPTSSGTCNPFPPSFSHPPLPSAWFAFALPCYSTYKALAHSASADTLQALAMYWAVIGAFVAFEQTLGLFLSWSVLPLLHPLHVLNTLQDPLLLGAEDHFLIVPLASPDPGPSHFRAPFSLHTTPLGLCLCLQNLLRAVVLKERSRSRCRHGFRTEQCYCLLSGSHRCLC